MPAQETRSGHLQSSAVRRHTQLQPAAQPVAERPADQAEQDRPDILYLQHGGYEGGRLPGRLVPLPARQRGTV